MTTGGACALAIAARRVSIELRKNPMLATPLDTTALPGRAFATTHWSLVLHAADAADTVGRAALEELCRSYWPALFVFARRNGMDRYDAEDLTQGFLADLLARGALARADASRGRFRTFLLTAFKNYASAQRARHGALKRGGGCGLIAMDELGAAESELVATPALAGTPESHFDRAWADQLLDRALTALGAEYEQTGRAAVFAAVRDTLWAGRGEVDYPALAGRLGLTEGALKVAVHRLRRRFGHVLRAAIADTVADPSEVDAELRHLLAAYAR
jgi:RNA polymerase sigma factor (sigma-70 family)